MSVKDVTGEEKNDANLASGELGRGESSEPESVKPETETKEERTVPPLKQLWAWAAGDRDAEARSLAGETTGNDADDDQVLRAAKKAVSDAHGDTGIGSKDESKSDVARPVDVVQAAQELPVVVEK